MKSCVVKAKVKIFPPLSEYVELGNRFFGAVPEAVKKVAYGNSDYSAIPQLREKVFKRVSGINSYDNETNMTNLIRAEIIGSTSEDEHEDLIAAYTDKVLSYIRNSERVRSDLLDNEKTATDCLNKLLRHAQSMDDSNGISDIQKLASMVGQFTNALITEIVRARNAADAIANRAVAIYREQVRGIK